MTPSLINEQQLRELRLKALIIVGLPLGIAASLFCYWTYTILGTQALNELTAVLTARTIGQASDLNTHCTRATSELAATATFTAITASDDLELYRKLVRRTLSNLKLSNATFIGFAETERDADGQQRPLLYAVRKNGEITLRDVDEIRYLFQDWFLLPRLLNKTAWTDPYYSELSGEMRVACGVPLFIGDRFIGVAGNAISIEQVAKIVEQINIQGSHLILISDSGTVIVHPDQENILRHTLVSLANKANSRELLELARRLKKNRTAGIVRLEKGILGEPREYVAYAPIANNNWTLLSVIPEEAVLAPLKARLLLWIIYGCVVGILLYVILYYLVTAALRKNLSNEAMAARASLFAEASVHSQTEFLRDVSHDLRTPLNAIVGFANIARFCDVTPDVRKLLDGIGHAANKLTRLIDAMVVFADQSESQLFTSSLSSTPFPAAEESMVKESAARELEKSP